MSIDRIIREFLLRIYVPLLAYIIGIVVGTLLPIHHWYEVLIMVAAWCFSAACTAYIVRHELRRSTASARRRLPGGDLES